MDKSILTTVNSLIQLFVLIVLVFVCIKRRQRGNFPAIMVVASWLMLLTHFDQLATVFYGPEFLSELSAPILPEAWQGDAYSIFSISSLFSFVGAIGFLLFAIGVFLLARIRTRETMNANIHQPPTS